VTAAVTGAVTAAVTMVGVSTDPAPAAVVRGARKAYGSVSVLQGLDLRVPAAGVTALLGPSGCGKTTLLRALAGFDRVDAGTIEVAGRLVDGPSTFVPARRRGIGYVPQEGALFPHLSVAANIGFGVPRRDRHRRTGEMLALIGLPDFGHRRVGELSGGQQQRVALARALAVEPALVLLDEPFSALDAGLRAQVRGDVLSLLRATGTAALLVTHDQEEALSVADQVAVLAGGRIAQAGTPERLHTAPVDAAVAEFLGAGTLLPAVRRGSTVECALGSLPVSGPGDEPAGPPPADRRTAGRVLVRSEQVVLGAADAADAAGAADAAARRGRVTERTYYGHDAVVDVELDGGSRVRARCDGGAAPHVEDLVSVSVAGAVLFFGDGPSAAVGSSQG